MAEEIDDNDFYHEDFSTKSDWESFNAQLGEIIQEWNLSAADKGPPLTKNQLFTTNWDIKTDTLKLGKKEFTVSYYQASIPDEESTESTSLVDEPKMFSDLMSLENTFCPTDKNNTHLLAKWYGLRRFLLVEQTHGYISNANDCSFFLSSASVVAAETNSTVPIFIPVFNPSWNFFLGVWVDQSIRINFDVVALENGPPSCKYLSGLLMIFKEKLNGFTTRAATVSVRQTYALGNITKYTNRMKVPFFANHSSDLDLLTEDTPMEGTYFVALPYGYFGDSKTELLIHCTWPEIAENVAIDTANYSDFVVSKAHAWSVRAITRARSYLSSALDDFLDLQKSSQTVESYVGRSYGSTTGDEPNPLDQLTKSKFDVTASPFRKWSPQKKLAGPLKDNELAEMISYIFPDMQSETLFAYSKTANKFDPLRIKSAGHDSLVVRLSCLLATCNSHFGGKGGMAQLWANFTMELRYRLDNCLQIPGVSSGFPDMRTCLLHQKLQMLNICMERRRIRECGMPFGTSEKDIVEMLNAEDENQEDEGTDDEFFDCSDDESINSGGALKPLGRKSKLGDMKLIDSDEFLYVPATQDPVPKTEDQLLDDAEVMLKLGPGSGLSTQMMCSSLRSDMESFKAANPNGKIVDFIRWYSPRDWEEETDEDGIVKGKLSPRMTAPDNTWQSVWKQAQPVPAYRQKRLFDDTNEALKVLHYLETRSIGEIYELTIVTLLHSAVLKLKDIITYSNILEAFNDQIEEILSDLCKLSRDTDRIPDNSVIDLLKKIQNLEKTLYQYKNLERLFPNQCPPNEKERKIMIATLSGDEVVLPGASKNTFARRILEKYRLEVASSDSGKVLPDPASKEYVIRLEGDSSSSGPQFLRAITSGSRVRLCGAFSENTTFV